MDCDHGSSACVIKEDAEQHWQQHLVENEVHALPGIGVRQVHAVDAAEVRHVGEVPLAAVALEIRRHLLPTGNRELVPIYHPPHHARLRAFRTPRPGSHTQL